ncbi:MAG: hypothetical protein ACXVB1_14210, partial [Pseudobdellovibrionaceae bacterium]
EMTWAGYSTTSGLLPRWSKGCLEHPSTIPRFHPAPQGAGTFASDVRSLVFPGTLNFRGLS